MRNTHRALAVAGLLLVPAVLVLSGCASKPTAVAGSAGPASEPTTTASSATTTSQQATSGAASSTPASSTPATPPTLPTGYHNELIQGSTTADRPVGWTRSQAGQGNALHTDFRDPSGQLLLRVGFLETTQAPDKAIRDLASRTTGEYQGYKLVRLSSLTSTRSQNGTNLRAFAEWEFTFVKDGVTRRVIIRAIGGANGEGNLTPATYDSVYFSAPEQYFDQMKAVYQRAVSTLAFDL